MAAGESSPTNAPVPRCTHCGAVIGVYEPAIEVAGQSRRETSRAARPDLVASSAAVYHAGCYEESRGLTG